MLTVDGPAALVEGRGAFIVAQLLARSLRNGLTLAQLLAQSDFAPGDRDAAMTAALALEEAGEKWRISQLAPAAIRGNAATGGNGEPLTSDAMVVESTRSAAMLLNRGERRVRQLAASGVLPGVRTPGGWRFERPDVIEYRKSLSSAL